VVAVTGPIAVVAAACRFPGADDLDGYWDLIRSGRVVAQPVGADRWRHEWIYRPDHPRTADSADTELVAHLSTVDRFPAERYDLSARRIEVTDPQHRLLVQLTDVALHGLPEEKVPRRRTGVYIGASVSEYKDLLTSRIRAGQMAAGDFGVPLDAAAARSAVEGVTPPRAYSIPGTLLNMAAATVSSVFDLGGPSFVVDAACSSALVALHEAVTHLRAGQCDLAIAGGVYLNLVPDNLIGFSRIGAISRTGVCRPFDRRADGFVLGEGAGVAVLKRFDDAIRDGDRVYAVIRGTGCTNDGRADGPMTPRLEGQQACLRQAYADAGVDPDTVALVECHGTATPVGDAVELAALRAVLGDGADTHVSSVKANIGHTMSAAGIAGFLKAVLALVHATVPAQVGCDEPDPAIGTLRITPTSHPWAARPGSPRRAAVSSFGFGGTNVHVVLEEAPVAAATGNPAMPPQTGARYWAVRRGAAPAPDPALQPAAPIEPDEPAVPTAPLIGLLTAIASTSAYPVQSLRQDQTLVDDLGFDSLMLVELETILSEQYPGLKLPDELLQRTTTIGQVDQWLRESMAGSSDPVASAAPLLDPAALPEFAALADRFALGNELGLPNPYFVVHDGAFGATTHVEGIELVNFSGTNYLGLATDPDVIVAAQQAIARYGTSVSASRIASGERPLHGELEAAVAGLLGTEAALVMATGHATNVGVLGHLLRPGDLAVHDALVHNSILQGIQLSGAQRRPFGHNDLTALDQLLSHLAGRHRRVLVAVDGAYSMDGDLADLPGLVELRRRHGFLLYVDDAHGVGVLGKTGRGAAEHWGIPPSDVDIWMGTLSKALASNGGYVAGAARLIEYLRYTTPGFLYSVGLPPAAAAAALAALYRLRTQPDRVVALRANTELFRRLVVEAGLDPGPGGAAIVPVITGSSIRALRLADRMRLRGVNVAPILHPAVEEEAARLRFFLNATHTETQIRATVAALREELVHLDATPR
jgi:8-amino-7-oxononanoate synthase